MKLYIMSDLEGVAGVCDQAHQCSFNHDRYDHVYVAGTYGPFYHQARRLATLELNALVEGVLQAGATEVVAWDGHCRFPGGLDVEILHPECQLVMNAGDGGPAGLDDSFDALLLHGAHAKQGAAAAALPHMLFDGLQWNGSEIGEIGMACATAASLGIPLIFISGDRAAIAEARAFVPDIEAVMTKAALHTRAVGVFDIAPLISLAPAMAQALIRQGARRAVERIGQIAAPPKPPFDPLASAKSA